MDVISVTHQWRQQTKQQNQATQKSVNPACKYMVWLLPMNDWLRRQKKKKDKDIGSIKQKTIPKNIQNTYKNYYF